MLDQVALLKQLAKDKYGIDGGTMYECFTDADYTQCVADYKTAKKAWSAHLDVIEAQNEHFGGLDYENRFY
tara:strand:+ start:125 stop:337 length:213 start_codon:yes stop_codon:yes gene_type:complete